MAGICRVSAFNTLRSGINLLRSQEMLCRSITTSPKKDDSTNVIVSSESSESSEKKKPWVSYGFDDEEREDRRKMHESFFFGITIGLVATGYLITYKPDLRTLSDWAKREAYLQIRYREEHGLPYIDVNLVDPAKFTLPTDEELGDTDIII
ncbi:hypothetical protein M0802_010989 [Mischocyttarus mexicanus]|nr:hypothetical protein M0802_010989 [Mischocyttarus mexicanus]